MLNRLLEIFISPRRTRKILILGLHYTGKTTLLYFLKDGNLHRVMQTIPTIGFNAESLRFPDSRDYFVAWDLGGGCGGHMRSLLKYYFSYTEAIIWMVDSADRNFLEESLTELKFLFNELDQELGVEVSQKIPFLILANKQDLPNAIRIPELHPMFAAVCQGRIWTIVPASVVTEDVGIPTGISWLCRTLSGQYDPAENVSFSSAPAQVSQTQGEQTETRVSQYVKRAIADEASLPDHAFLARFKAADLPSWDHYTHVRVAYVLLKVHGRQKGKNDIFDGIQHYIATNKTQSDGRKFHVTMTYFWIQLVHFGIMLVGQDLPPTTSEEVFPLNATLVEEDIGDSGKEVTSVKKGEPLSSPFASFLLANPYLAEPALWERFYSRELMMSPGAKAAMVLPDKTPLPSIRGRDTV
ncbi:Arf-domain-containing protein [Punctularia strigosozonata HHB-11173 SS5]|uniref:Arf-domain-containing protein n=1 Tax=Punctularia strigosozonata (strain HHB-11173) TaxID=741275 RepID=UPI0004417BCB|nr:Arf-domain-containing protein [Punctularia strigosozonata HHB-11173 SS5]EIN10296.1 Arf-domain-containing protein [Punctularia strigosozonata HHB-11173 SS5]